MYVVKMSLLSGFWLLSVFMNNLHVDARFEQYINSWPDECFSLTKGFSSDMVDIGIEPTDNLSIVEKKMDAICMGATDCAKPMIDAMERKIKDIDVFVVYTDNETWFGRCHPCEALRNYRMCSDRPNAKLVVVGMCATEFTIADQEDPNMLDVVGFDSAAPRLISEFAMDRI